MADDSIQVEYNESLTPLVEILRGVERAGDFVVNGKVEVPMPRVEVAGVGVLSFPVPPAQVQLLVQQATRAPYGRGPETILDESVRKVWQLAPEKIQLGGKSWAASFDGILKQVIAGLGCEGLPVSAELYKFLVYDTGGFFLAHRDTEKAAGMFGTLVVVLPSAHRGGELVLRHAGREVTVDLSGGEVSELTFAAFYADCEHEVKPVTEGSRVCLIYNLLQQRDATRGQERLHAPDYERQTASAARLLAEHLSAPEAPAKIAWLLEHHYSPDGLSFAGLKSGDAARVQVLAQAAERADCAAHLGIVHIEESGAANPSFQNYRPRRWGRYGGAGEIEDAGAGDFEVIEVSDSRHYLAEWVNGRDEPVAFGEIPLAPGELLPAGALDDEKPDQQRLLEASGNEGASFERAYHRAALVLWRRERYAEVLLQAGVTAALPYLQERISAAEAPGAPPAARQEAMGLARRVVQAWAAAPRYGGYGQPARPSKRDDMLRLLTQLGDTALLDEFIAEVVTTDYDGSENAALLAGARLLGATQTGERFEELLRLRMPSFPGPGAELLRGLAFDRELTGSAQWKSALRRLAAAAVGAFCQTEGDAPPGAKDAWPGWPAPRKTGAVEVAMVVNLMDALGELEAPELRAAAVKKFAARSDVFDPVAILAPALGQVRQRDAATGTLWQHCARFLLHRSGRPPAAPTDWRQDVTLSCACADCRELQAFVHHPEEQTHRFRVRQDRRQHLHQMIEQHGLDLNHVTERTGSPQTLVCTKTRRTYQRRCDQYREDIAALALLAELADPESAPAAARQNIEAARALAAQWSPA